jgi:saccharopine dehydrogenase-like NADP-dependent oxidoreductase
MRKILVLGAGRSAPFLIHYLLEHAQELDAQITVGDADSEAAKARVAQHERGRAIRFDLADIPSSEREFSDADIVVHLLPPQFQPLIAKRCVEHRCHLVSASYRSRELRYLEADAKELGVSLLCELGLDPGMDLMSAQQLIDGLHAEGGTIESFYSYGGGLPEESFAGNPLRYCITWNPRNVAMAGEAGAQFLRQGRIQLLPWQRVFRSTWLVDVPGLGPMDAYANRDSLAYRAIHGLPEVHTLIRATLRYPGYCGIWQQIVDLGLPNEHLEVPDLENRSWAELVEMFLPPGGGDLEQRTAEHLGLGPKDPRFEALRWLGLFSQRSTHSEGNRPVDALITLLQEKLVLPPATHDLVVLHHELAARFGGRRRHVESTFVHRGDERFTAMSKAVGLPAALGVRLLLEGHLEGGGCLSPTDAAIYRPIMAELAKEGLVFEERVRDEDLAPGG